MIKDVKGNDINIGDIIYRSTCSSLTIHKVLKFTRRFIVLSTFRKFGTYTTYDGKTANYSWVVKNHLYNELISHNDKVYVYYNTGVNTNLIKY